MGVVSVREEIRKRLRERVKRLKNDIYIAMMIEQYPVIKDFLEDPRPFSVATFGGYLKLMKNAENVNEEVRKRILELEKQYVDMLNEKLLPLGGVWVTVDENGYTILNYVSNEGVKQFKLAFNDIMNIYGGRNIDAIVEKIIERAEGRYYNTVYRPLVSP